MILSQNGGRTEKAEGQEAGDADILPVWEGKFAARVLNLLIKYPQLFPLFLQ